MTLSPVIAEAFVITVRRRNRFVNRADIRLAMVAPMAAAASTMPKMISAASSPFVTSRMSRLSRLKAPAVPE